MEIIFKSEALLDLNYWKKSGNRQIQKKIHELLEDILKHPETGIGKPEKLKHSLCGVWSRRIDKEHRIVYDIVGDYIHVLSLKGHY